MPNLFLLVLQVAVILLTSRAVGKLFLLIGQPRVVGEMAAGIVIGPSLLGWLAPSLFTAVFPASSLGYLNALSQFGLIMFMFLIGLELNPKELRKLRQVALIVSNASCCQGGALALYLYPRLSSPRVTFDSFALFFGAAMSITAFPVLARIL